MSDTNNEFQRGYEAFVKTASSHIAMESAVQSTEWVAQVEREYKDLEERLNNYKNSHMTTPTLGGYVAEHLVAATFNADAIHHGSSNRAKVLGLNTFASADIKLDSGEEAQLKIYSTGKASAKAESISYHEAAKSHSSAQAAIDTGINEHAPIYEGKIRIVAADQLKEGKSFCKRKIIEERGKRPHLVEKYQDSYDNLSDVLKDSDHNQSTPLTRSKIIDITDASKKGKFKAEKYGLSPKRMIDIPEVLGHSLKAGMSAATISLVLSTTPAIIETIQQLITSGELDIEQMKATGVTGVKSGAKGFVSGFITASITESARIGFLGKTIKGAIDINPSAIGAVAVIASNALSYSLKAASGEMTLREVADNVTRDVIVTSASLAAGGFTYSAITGIVGQSTLPIPIFGYLVGSFVGSAIAGLGYTAGKQVLLGLCVEHGLTLFGLVDQDYELPENELTELGIDIAEFDKFELPEPMFDQAEFDEFSFDKFEPERIELTILHRGLIGVSKVGYVS